MHTRFPLKIACAALLLLLAACQPLAAVSLTPASTPTPAPFQGANTSVLGASALTVQMADGGASWNLVPISAQSGAPVSGYAPVNLGRQIDTFFSSDRALLAYLMVESPDCNGQCLHVLDLRTWKPAALPVFLTSELAAWCPGGVFLAQGKQVALVLDSQVDDHSQVLLTDLYQGALLQQADFNFSIQGIAVTPQGRLAVYGPSAQGQPAASLHVALLDATSLKTLWEQDLSQVNYTSYAAAENPNDPTSGKYLMPAVVFSPDGSRLYAVAADEPLLATVDFSERSVRSATIQAPQSLLDRLMQSLAGVAYAKTLNGSSKTAVISPDGRTLYVTGQTSQAVQDAGGNLTAKTTPLGLQMVNAANGALTASLATDATSLALSPDGHSLFLHGWAQTSSAADGSWTDVVDVGKWTVAKHLEGNFQPTYLLDGSSAWLNSQTQPDGTYRLAVYAPGADAPRSTWSAPMPGFADWLPVP